jgi:hypothetical protein
MDRQEQSQLLSKGSVDRKLPSAVVPCAKSTAPFCVLFLFASTCAIFFLAAGIVPTGKFDLHPSSSSPNFRGVPLEHTLALPKGWAQVFK